MNDPTQPADEIGVEATLPPPTNPDAEVTLAPSATSAAVGDDPRAPKGYSIERELGRGGMGVVYLARSLALERPCALKMILAGSHSSSGEIDRFRIEAQAVARLQHPGIVQVFEIGEHGGTPFMALELCSGGSLDARLARSPMKPREAAGLVRSLAEAMQAAHQAQVIHRDLKPANVLLSADGAPKITDFGLAKKLDDDSGVTRTGTIMGTPSYMAPEQAEGKKSIGPLADVYSLGAILYECVTGRPPFRAATPLDTILQVVHEEPLPPTRLNPNVPRDLETIALRCLHKDPARRYDSAQALADDLGQFLADEPIAARPIGWIEQTIRWARRRPWAAALVGVSSASVLSLLVLGVGFTVRLRQERDFARDQERLADEQRRRAEAGEAEAQRQLDQARRALLAGQILRVVAVWERDPARGLALLSDPVACPPNYRDPAWAFFWRVCRHQVSSPAQPRFFPFQARSSMDDRQFLVGGALLENNVMRGVVRRWDAATSAELKPLEGHRGFIACLELSSDGRTLLTGGSDGTVRIWDLETGRERSTLTQQVPWVTAVRFVNEGRMVAAGVGTSIRIWNLATGEETAVMTGHTGYVVGLDASRDGRLLASASYDGTVKLWDVRSGTERRTLRGHLGYVTSVAFANDDRLIVSGGYDRTVRLWPADESEPAVVWSYLQPMTGLAVSPDGAQLAVVCGEPGELQPGLVTIESLTERRRLAARTAGVDYLTSVQFNPAGDRLLITGWDGQLHLRDSKAVPRRNDQLFPGRN